MHAVVLIGMHQAELSVDVDTTEEAAAEELGRAIGELAKAASDHRWPALAQWRLLQRWTTEDDEETDMAVTSSAEDVAEQAAKLLRATGNLERAEKELVEAQEYLDRCRREHSASRKRLEDCLNDWPDERQGKTERDSTMTLPG